MTNEAIDSVLAGADETVIAAMNEHTLPGLAAGIVHQGTLVYARGFGLADAQEERPVTPDTTFRIGSISKTFTAIGLMQLWEQGKFQLDDSVNDYLKAYEVLHRDPGAPPVTFRHLLTHTSGIGEFRHISDLARFRRIFALGAREGEPVPALREYYGGRLAPDVPPGEKWAYANHGFATLGQLVEDMSGEPFEEYMMGHVFEPLGMLHTDYLLSDRVRDQFATGYQLKKGRLKSIGYQEIVVRAAGSMFSSVNDMAKYVAALMNGGRNEHGSVLKPETLSMMMEPHYRADERLPAMGLAFFLDALDGHATAGHDGGWPGFVSSMLVAPADDLGVVVFTNTSSMAPHAIATDLLGRLFGIPAETRQLPRPGILETPHLWPDLCGLYGPSKGFVSNARVWMEFGGEVEVFVQGNHLAVRSSLLGPTRKASRLYPIDAADPLVFETEVEGMRVPVVFRRNDAGEVDRLCAAGIGHYTLHKRPSRESLRFRSRAAMGGLAALFAAILGRRMLRRR